MKKSKLLIMFMVMAMFVSCIMPLGNVSVSAKGNRAVRKTTMYVGDKQQWYMTLNLKKVSNKKVKWKSLNKKVATVSKKGVVKAKKKGNAKIIAKYKGNTLVLKVKVKKQPNTTPIVPPAANTNNAGTTVTPPAGNNNTTVLTNSQLAANMSLQAQPLKDGSLLFLVTNNNAQLVTYYSVNYQLQDTAGVVIGTGNETGHAIGSGKSQYIRVYVGEELANVDVNKSVCSITVSSTFTYADETANVKVECQNTSDNDIAVTYYNGSANKVSMDVVVLFYDAAGQLVASKWDYASLASGQTAFDTITTPYDWDANYNKVPTFATYQVFYYPYSY